MDDEKMQEMAESVAQYGVLVPGIVRPRSEGGYEIVAGHRRKRASELAGKAAMPVIVRDMDDNEAIIIMVDSNLQREKILPSEKAFAYKMKMDALHYQENLPLRPAVEVSYLPLDEQELLYDVIEDKAFGPPSMEQAKKLREYSGRTELTTSLIIDILSDEKSSPVKITLKKKCLNQYFPKGYTQQQMEEVIFSLLETWKSQQKGAVPNDSDG